MSEESITFGIVEDEAIERTAMALYIKNTFPEAEVLWQAEDGKSGLEAWKTSPPQILIVDISMPVMDGLSMIEELNALHCDSVIVINTAYDSFTYARRAISLRAFDYIVKPAENDELKRILSACMEEARRRRAILHRRSERAQAMKSLGQLTVSQLMSHPKNAVASSLFFEPLGWPENSSYHTRVIHFVAFSALDAEKMRALEDTLRLFPDTEWLVASHFASDKRMTALIDTRRFLEPQKMYTLLWMFGEYHARRMGIHIRVSGVCQDKEAIAQEVAWTPPLAVSPRLDMPRRNWRFIRSAEAEKMTHTLERFFSDGQFGRAHKYLGESRRECNDDSAEWELAQWVFAAMLTVWPERNLMDAVAPLYRLDTSEQRVGDTLIAYCETLPALDTGDVIERALRIMKTEFGGDLSQSSLALRLGLDQGYFSRLFKKRCGRNFSQVLLEIRMRRAEEILLKNPDVTLDELCSECGLSSKTYFSEVFKKWKGMTITQFLKSRQ